MIEIAQLLQEKVGLSPEQSQAAAQVIASHLQARLPESLQGMVFPLLGLQQGAAEGQSADAGTSSAVGGLLSEVTSMFGGSKG